MNTSLTPKSSKESALYVGLRRWLDGDKHGTSPQTRDTTVVRDPNNKLFRMARVFILEGRQVVFPIMGCSMRIFVEDKRDKAILAPFDAAALKRGDVVLAWVMEGYYVLHRIVQAEGEILTLMGDGNTCGVEHCRRGDVVAQVIGFIRKGRKRPDMVTGQKWRVYSMLWISLRPLRRWLLLAWRIKRRIFGYCL